MLYLVDGEVTYFPYMNSAKPSRKEIRLVEASSYEGAYRAFEFYFTDKGSPNDDSYLVSNIKVHEIITE